jgi:hypothetical protein
MPIFPQNIPSGCPPEDSRFPNDVTVFRVVAHNPPMASDFQTTVEMGKFPNHPEQCRRWGMSVCLSLSDARQLMRIYPQLGSHVAEGVLGSHHGRIKQTPGVVHTHTTWWPCQNVIRENGFAVV